MSIIVSPARKTLWFWAAWLASGVVPCGLANHAFSQIARTSATACPDLTFACLRPEFLKTAIPAYAQQVSPTSPAPYSEADHDYRSQFTSPGGVQVTVVVKSPVTTQEYQVPPLSPNEDVNHYLNNAFYEADGHLRSQTIIKFPRGTYRLTWPLRSNCDQSFNWLLPAGLTDVVIDGQGSRMNFSGLCNGVGLWGATRVVLKNFSFSWSNLEMASVGTVTAVNTTTQTYMVHVDPIRFGPSPRLIASVFAWDKAHDHVDLVHWRDSGFYGDGVTAGAPYQCAEPTAEEAATAGCTVTLNAQGAVFQEGQSVVLHFYNYGGALQVFGQDITLDHLTLENVIGTAFALQGGRGLRVTHSTLTRMAGEPVGIEGNASAEFGSVSGDVVFDDNFFGYSGDDGFQLNWNIVQYSPDVANPLSQYQLMPSFAFNPAVPRQFQWPYFAAVGDEFALYDNELTYEGTKTITAVDASTSPSTITLDSDLDHRLVENGFIGGDLTPFAGARYVVSNNTFQYTAGRALLLQTPFGLVDHNRFVGQTQRQLYLMTSLFWGEGGSAQELTISNNIFDATGHGGAAPTVQGGDFLAIDIAAEPADPFLNLAPELFGSKGRVTPPVNQNIVVANNTFISDRVTAVVNLSSANNIVFSGNHFQLADPARAPASAQYPVALHDASNIFFDDANEFSVRWLMGGSCENSRLLRLANPLPSVSVFPPLACGILDTTSDVVLRNPRVLPLD